MNVQDGAAFGLIPSIQRKTLAVVRSRRLHGDGRDPVFVTMLVAAILDSR